MKTPRDEELLKRIIIYCEQIEATVNRMGDSFDAFDKDIVYRNAIALCLLQIGELTTHLSAGFKEAYTMVPWAQIKALRNIVAHNYGSIDNNTLWESVTNDIPFLKQYSNELLRL